jgi:uncharacterized protein (DUF1800 family)
MLLYLDNAGSSKEAPNENFSRELMELFTIGIGNYTETDVKEAARALTGWRVAIRLGRGIFDPRAHDFGSKTFLGETGNFDGDDIMDILFTQPHTAPFICSKLYEFFIHPEPPEADIEVLVGTWDSSGGDIKTVMDALLQLDSFWAEESRHALVKSPVDYVLGLAQRWHITDSAVLQSIGRELPGMGQVPLRPPHVAGYPENLEWAGTSSLLTRYNTANSLLNGRISRGIVQEMLRDADVTSADKLVDSLLINMGVANVTSTTREQLIDYVGGDSYQPNTLDIAIKSRGVLHLIVSTPEYQLN